MSALDPILADLSPRFRAGFRERLYPVETPPGDTLVEEGEDHAAVLFIESGKVDIHSGGVSLATLGAGDVLGEIALFSSLDRTATATAQTSVTFQVLPRESFEHLRAEGNPAAWAVEHLALNQLRSRLGHVLGLLHAGSVSARWLQPLTTPNTVWQPGPGADPNAALAQNPLFDGIDPATFPAIASLLEQRIYSRGTQPSGGLHLLMKGPASCHVQIGPEHRLRLGTLRPGELFGMNAILPSEHRLLQPTVDGQATVWTLAATRAAAVLVRPDAIGSALRTAVIRALSHRLHQANAAISLGS